ERKERVEDALHATRAAVNSGILPGGGVALIRAAKRLKVLEKDSDFLVGVDIIRKACKEPLKQIASNAGKVPEIILEKVSSKKLDDFGYNARTDKFENMKDLFLRFFFEFFIDLLQSGIGPFAFYYIA
ncbi:MAG TPA: hypothetical protein EYQ20_16855, partial [candidate division Zixibacteria bacterium]|nr:hypothetical protein [candidate division Zixibacteria bacterium]